MTTILRERLKALAQELAGGSAIVGLHVLLRREGRAVNKNAFSRLYREEQLMVQPARRAQAGPRSLSG